MGACSSLACCVGGDRTGGQKAVCEVPLGHNSSAAEPNDFALLLEGHTDAVTCHSLWQQALHC